MFDRAPSCDVNAVFFKIVMSACGWFLISNGPPPKLSPKFRLFQEFFVLMPASASRGQLMSVAPGCSQVLPGSACDSTRASSSSSASSIFTTSRSRQNWVQLGPAGSICSKKSQPNSQVRCCASLVLVSLSLIAYGNPAQKTLCCACFRQQPHYHCATQRKKGRVVTVVVRMFCFSGDVKWLHPTHLLYTFLFLCSNCLCFGAPLLEQNKNGTNMSKWYSSKCIHTIPFHSITLHYIKLHYIKLHYTLHSIAFHSIAFHSSPVHYITLHYTTLHYITLHHITSHYITLHHIHHITSHYITLHHITSHYITLHHLTSHDIAWHRSTSHYITLHHATSHCATHYVTLHHTTSHYVTLHHITSHYVTLHHITSHYITYHHIPSHTITCHHIPSHTITYHHIASHSIT